MLIYLCTTNVLTYYKYLIMNQFAIMNRTKQLVSRSAAPRYKSNFALTTDVNLLRSFDDFVATMLRASESMPDAHFIHFKVDTDSPSDVVRIVPSILQSFNRTRTMRRARISGLRMCNLYSFKGDWYYCSDMVVSCCFDAVAVASALADFSSVGSFVTVRLRMPAIFKGKGKSGVGQFCERIIDKFWAKSKLARHSVHIHFDEHRSYDDILYFEFEPKSIACIALLNYILNAFHREYESVELGRNCRLVITRRPLIIKEDYLIFSPDKQLNNIRYKHKAAFGIYYNNPDYPIY